MNAHNNLSVTRIDNLYDLLIIKEEWNKVLHLSDSDNPFSTFEWLSSWWNYFSDGGKFFVLLVKDGDRIIAIAPLMIVRKGIFRVLQFIGTGRTDYLDFIVAEKRRESLEAIFKYICDSKKHWDIINLRDISSDSQNLGLIKEAIDVTSMASDEITGTLAPYMPINCNWDQYLAKKSSKFRNNIRREAKKLEEAGDVEITCQSKATSEQVEILHNIEKYSWKANAGSLRLGDKKACEFYNEILKKFSSNNWLNLWLLHFNGEPIAYSVNFAYKSKIFNYNVAYKSEYGNFYPGKVITAKIIEDAFNHNIVEYDFLRGDEDYKTKWTSDKRELRYIAIYKKSLYSMFAFLLIVKLRWTLKEYRFAYKLNLLRVKCIHNIKKITQFWKAEAFRYIVKSL